MKVKSKSRERRPHENFGLQLPRDYMWRVLGYLTEDLSQFLAEDENKLIRGIVRNRDVAGIFSLSKVWGLQSMPLSDASLDSISAKYQLAALLKKFQFPTSREARKRNAMDKFFQAEVRCGLYNREGYVKLSWAQESWMVNVFTYAKSFCQKVLGDELPPLNVMTDRSRHGPGATLDTLSGQNSSYDKYEKWPYQCTARAHRYARWLITHDERWLGALEDDYRDRFNIPKHTILDRQVFWESVLEVVPGNRITFVPKNAEILRSIAIEPTMNLVLQLGVDGVIRRRLKRWGFDLDHQEKNQWLALLGSREDSYTTIDLADASNSVTIKVCELLLPEEWCDYLKDLRSPCGILGKDGEIVEYEMLSSMGNGYTFALESLIFAALIYGVMMETWGCFDRDKCAVFGDDLIVPKELTDRLIHALDCAGFRVNVEKSFLSGPVRESCGTDWFLGRPVRPVFLEDYPTDVAQLFNDLNRLKRVLRLRWGIEESRTETELMKWIPEEFREIRGPFSDEVFDAYIHSAHPNVPYRQCVYRYRTLVRTANRNKAPKFLFRKLMHDLRPLPPINKWEKRKEQSSGSRFRVFFSHDTTLGKNHSVASYWRCEYGEYWPHYRGDSR